jgi:hypothetical protein
MNRMMIYKPRVMCPFGNVHGNSAAAVNSHDACCPPRRWRARGARWQRARDEHVHVQPSGPILRGTGPIVGVVVRRGGSGGEARLQAGPAGARSLWEGPVVGPLAISAPAKPDGHDGRLASARRRSPAQRSWLFLGDATIRFRAAYRWWCLVLKGGNIDRGVEM